MKQTTLLIVLKKCIYAKKKDHSPVVFFAKMLLEFPFTQINESCAHFICELIIL